MNESFYSKNDSDVMLSHQIEYISYFSPFSIFWNHNRAFVAIDVSEMTKVVDTKKRVSIMKIHYQAMDLQIQTLPDYRTALFLSKGLGSSKVKDAVDRFIHKWVRVQDTLSKVQKILRNVTRSENTCLLEVYDGCFIASFWGVIEIRFKTIASTGKFIISPHRLDVHIYVILSVYIYFLEAQWIIMEVHLKKLSTPSIMLQFFGEVRKYVPKF